MNLVSNPSIRTNRYLAKERWSQPARLQEFVFGRLGPVFLWGENVVRERTDYLYRAGQRERWAESKTHTVM